MRPGAARARVLLVEDHLLRERSRRGRRPRAASRGRSSRARRGGAPRRGAPRRRRVSSPGPPRPRTAANGPRSSAASQSATSRRNASSSGLVRCCKRASRGAGSRGGYYDTLRIVSNQPRGAGAPAAPDDPAPTRERTDPAPARRGRGCATARSPPIEDGDVALDVRGAARARRCARRARSSPPGVAPGDRVAIWAPNAGSGSSPRSALQCAGAVLVPLNTRLKGAEAGYDPAQERREAAAARSRASSTPTTSASLAGEALPALERDRDAARRRAPARCRWRTSSRAATAVPEASARARARRGRRPTTSPTCSSPRARPGSPKGVMTAHGQNLRVFATWSEWRRAARGRSLPDREPVLPLVRLQGGLAVVPDARRDGAAARRSSTCRRCSQRIERERISVLPGPPTLYQSILAHPDRAPLRPLEPAARGDRRRGDPGRADPAHARRARLRDA